MPKTATKKATASKSNKKQQGETEPMLKEFFYDSLKDIYWAEKHLTKALPKLTKAASSEYLKNALSEHLEETKIQVGRLEQVFELLGEKAQAKKCEAMEGLSKEADSIVEDTEDGSATRDVGIIMSCQKVEHYEIAAYGGLAQLAKTLQLDEIADILEETLTEEKAADDKLTDIAENDINFQAATETEEEAE
jgi:ferritin-like metal-binding protein YciE